MPWTKDCPAEEGYYWVCDPTNDEWPFLGDVCCVKVIAYDSESVVFQVPEMDFSDPVADYPNAYWMGPIASPLPPVI